MNASEAMRYYYENHPTAGPIPENFRFYARDGAFIKRCYDREIDDWKAELNDAWEKRNPAAMRDIPSFVKALPMIRAEGAGKVSDEQRRKNEEMFNSLSQMFVMDKKNEKSENWVKDGGSWVRK